MDQTTQLLALVLIAALGIAAVVTILRRDRITTEEEATPEIPYAAATEGMKRCPSCGMGNLVTDDTCSNCGRKLPG